MCSSDLPQGRKVVDFQSHNLHLLSYSAPVHAKFSLTELRPHLFTLPDQPDLIPYRTSYYREEWGFCLTHHQLLSFEEGEYEVFVDSTLAAGSLTYGELFLLGESEREVLVSCHVCHPSLANDNLSGLAVCTFLAEALARMQRRLSYRFIFIPGTIGSITWLARNEVGNICGGLVAANLGDSGQFHYKKTRRGDADIDRAVLQVLRESGEEHTAEDFVPFGYDERQYNSPGFNLPVGCLMRSPNGTFPEYHTSADNMDFIKPEFLERSYKNTLQIIDILENEYKTVNLAPHGEPNLGKRGLYGAIGGDKKAYDANLPVFWMLNQSDGQHSLLDIALRAKLPYERIHDAAKVLSENELLRVEA